MQYPTGKRLAVAALPTLDHFVFTDASGAEYRLDQNPGTLGVWSSLDAVYVWYDSNAQVLHFADGTFWTMGSLSSGKERDAETGLDYFGARYFSGAQGRFTSADPTVISGQRVSDPQQWNMYSYARNNPLQFVDPDGKELRLAKGADATKIIPALAHAYTKADFRPLFDQLSSSKNITYVNNVHIEQDPANESRALITEGQNVPLPADPSQPISNTNLVNTIELDDSFVFGKGVTDYGKDFVIGHEFDHGAKIDRDPAGVIDANKDPAKRKAQEDAANKAGEKIGTENSSISTAKATDTVKKALGCSTNSSGATTCN